MTLEKIVQRWYIISTAIHIMNGWSERSALSKQVEYSPCLINACNRQLLSVRHGQLAMALGEKHVLLQHNHREHWPETPHAVITGEKVYWGDHNLVCHQKEGSTSSWGRLQTCPEVPSTTLWLRNLTFSGQLVLNSLTLPKATPMKQVYENVSKRLEVVSHSNLPPSMAIVLCKQQCTSEYKSTLKWDVQVHFRTSELFGQTEIDNVYNTCMVSNAHKDVADISWLQPCCLLPWQWWCALHLL